MTVEWLEPRRLLAMMRDDVPSSEYETCAQNSIYDPVVWIGRVDSTGTVRPGGSGVVIDEHWLLISGHQVTDQTYTSLVLGRGTNLFTDPGEIYAIRELITYPGYTGGWGGSRDDIALAYIADPIRDVMPAARFNGMDETGTHVALVGFGAPATPSTGLGSSDGTKRAGENVIDSIGEGHFGFGENYFLADFGTVLDPWNTLPLEFGATPGDSGGGWFNDSGELVALSNFYWGDFDGGPDSGGIRISWYNSWIDQTITSHESVEVTIARATAQGELTNAASIYFTATFSSKVEDFDAADVVATGTPGTLVPTVTPVGTGGMTYTIAVSGMTADGQVVVSIPADAAHNAGGNGNSASTALDGGVIFDVTAPTVSVERFTTRSATPTLTGTASDANGVARVSVRVGGETILATVADGVWTAVVPSPLADGTYDVQVTAVDNAGNSGSDGTSGELTVNRPPWQNPVDRFNVDAWSGVEPVDALLVINHINTRGLGPLLTSGAPVPPPYVDVNGDDQVTPVDVLLVINFINSQLAAGAEGESSPVYALAGQPTAILTSRPAVERPRSLPSPRAKSDQESRGLWDGTFVDHLSRDLNRLDEVAADIATAVADIGEPRKTVWVRLKGAGA